MELIHCKNCDSNLVNLIAVKIKSGQQEERNIRIQENYLSLKYPEAVKHFLKCYQCGKVSEFVVKNQRGCCLIETLKSKKDQSEPQNEIIDGGGGFS